MDNFCQFTGKTKGSRCKNCGYTLTRNLPDVPIRKCDYNCKYLNPLPIEREGIIEKVKCTCPTNKNGYDEQWHAAHICNAPEHQRHRGKPGQCLPTFVGPFDEDHQFEATFYHLCNDNCKYKQLEPQEKPCHI